MVTNERVIVEYRHYRLPKQFPVILLSGDRWKISSRKSDRLHFHNCLEIGICHSNSGIIEFENTTVPFKAGDITCIPQYLPHTTYSNQGEESLWSYIFVNPKELLGNMLYKYPINLEKVFIINRNLQLVLNKDLFPHINFLISSIIEELINKNFGYQTYVRGLMLTLYSELSRIISIRVMGEDDIANSNNDMEVDKITIVSNAIEYIHYNYMNPINAHNLASQCNLSINTFRKCFYEVMGVSPLIYLKNIRIDAACSLLLSTDETILTISEQVGFDSLSSFNRCFLKQFKMSANAWRNQVMYPDYNATKISILEYTGWM